MSGPSLTAEELRAYRGVAMVLDRDDRIGTAYMGALYAVAEQAALMDLSSDAAVERFREAIALVRADKAGQR